MTLDAKTAVVDNDFINHVIESNLKDEDLVTVLNTVFSELDLTAVMHPLVYEKELLPDKERIKLLFCKYIVQKAEFGDIFQNDAAKERYYIFLVSELYRALTGKALSATGKAVLSYWVRQNSLGEVHSVAMCLTCGCGIFLSDDGDSKALKAYVDLYIKRIKYLTSQLLKANLCVSITTWRSKSERQVVLAFGRLNT